VGSSRKALSSEVESGLTLKKICVMDRQG